MQPKALVDVLLASGRTSITTEEAREFFNGSYDATRAALSRLQRRGELFSPARGLYVPIPLEYRTWGAPPGTWFIDTMMRHLDRPYYVGLLTAASLHGASHHAPQVFQVITDRSLRPRKFGRIRLRFYKSRFVRDNPVDRLVVPTGYVTVSTRETTVVELVSWPRASGGLSNVATVIRELGELSGSTLARLAGKRGRSVVRRVGWLVEHFGAVDELEALRQAARVDVGEPSLLDPAGPRRGPADREWAVRINKQLQPDV